MKDRCQKRIEIYKITEMRDGCVYKTKIFKSLWVPMSMTMDECLKVAKEHGGDNFCHTKDYRFE